MQVFRMLQRRWLPGLAFLFALHAAGSAKADDASRLLLAREMVRSTHAADKMRTLMPALLQQMRPMLTQNGANTKMVDSFIESFNKRIDQQVDQFVDIAAQVYASEFTDDDLKAFLAFYKTPAGQHLLAKQIEITQAMAKAGQQWGQMVAKQVLSDFAKERANTMQKL